MSPASTQASGHRAQEVVELRASLMRVAFVFAAVTPILLLFDALTVYWGGRLDAIVPLFLLRFVWCAVALGSYALLKRGPQFSVSRLTLSYAAGCAVGGGVIAGRAIVLGAAESALAPGLFAFLLLCGTLTPSPWKRSLAALSCAFVTYVASLVVAGHFKPALREQWFTANGLGFGPSLTFSFLMLGASSFVSHILWSARREVYETQRLGRYRLVARIGRGGQGEVWLARQESLERDIAIKVLSSVDGEMIARFRREAHLASRLVHPNTIRVIDYGATSGGVIYLAMELLTGTNIDDLVGEGGPLPPARTIHLARQACSSLAEAHDAGIVHRDIKPANLYVTHIGDDYDFLKILDFGLARPSSGMTLTRHGDVIGTLAYMSPEMCTGERLDARSDVYSLGATLYYMTTKEPVFAGSLNEILKAHLTEAPVAPSARLGSPVPGDLESVILRCLAKDPKERFATIRDLDAALAACSDAGGWTKADSQRAWRASGKAERPLPRASGAELTKPE